MHSNQTDPTPSVAVSAEVRVALVAAGVLGFLGVALGAFGAHALKPHLSEYAQGIYATAVQYHLVHALALWGAAMTARQLSPRWCLRACLGFGIGVILFSGSLYVLAISGIHWLGAVTPVGGFGFLFGWGCLVMAALRTGPAQNAESTNKLT